MNHLDNIDSFNRFFCTKTLHPQVAVADLSHAECTFFDTRTYDLYAIILMDDVFGTLRRDGIQINYTKGSIVTIRPGQTLQIKLNHDCMPSGRILVFKQDLLEKTGLGRDFYMFSYFHSDYHQAIALSEMEYAVIRNCFSNLYAELLTQQDYLSGQMIRLGIGTMLSYVKRYYEKQHAYSAIRTETVTGKLDCLLSKYLGSGLPAQYGQPTVAWCAAQLNLSKGYFSEQIKREIKITAQDYIRNKMVAHAQVLLRQTNMTINEIAEELGFRYPNHFTRMFHHATGYAPLKYRKG